MKFFTRAWLDGELTDEEFEATIPRYRSHIESLALPEDVRALEDTRLHDATLIRLDRTASRLSLTLITGDLQQGYYDTTLNYLTNSLATATVEKLRSFLHPSDADLLYAEVDRGGAGFVHRLLFSTREEVAIPFDAIAIRQTQRSSR
jgi:hypothetical protein